MVETIRNNNDYVGYEYKDITVVHGMESLWTDYMTSFGWSLEGTSSSITQGFNTLNLKFKRDRKIRNKAELTRLQRQFENSVREIETLEKSKSVGAAVFAYAFGVVGTAFMAGSVFAYLGGILPLSIILAVPGFAGWIFPYFCYVQLRNKKVASVTPKIDAQYDIMYETCEKASSLLEK